MGRLKRFSAFMEQDGGLPSSAPVNVAGGDKIAGIGSDFPPVPPKNKLTKTNIRRRRLPKT